MLRAMLQSLRVRNLAVVEDLQVEFGPGLNVITGETGAGKSILVGALGLLLGERADRSMIRAGEPQCVVEAVFALCDLTAADAVLEVCGAAPCAEGRLVLRRVMAAEGGSRQFANDTAVTLQTLQRLGDGLVDLHGPHDHQSLLRADFQRDVLDAFGGLEGPRRAYAEAYARLRELEELQRELASPSEDCETEEWLAHQAREIAEARLDEVDEEALRAEHTAVANAQRVGELADAALAALTESETSAFNGLVAAQGILRELADLLPSAGEWREDLRTLSARVQDLARAIGDAATRIEADPARLQALEERLATLQRLKRKYGGTLAEVRAHARRVEGRLAEIRSRAQRLEEVNRELAEVRVSLDRHGEVLRSGRQTAALRLARAVERDLRTLGFPQVAVSVEVTPSPPGPAGMDRIEFGFAPNPGEPPRPLRSIASSGEISRVMLALKSVLAAHDRVPVLVFDEIDANLGGEMGAAVGKKLRQVARHRQVLCITHLPQVAVYGEAHYVVTKSVRGGRTRAEIRPVDGDDRVEELARMLSGEEITEAARRHAREWLQRR